MKEKLTLELLTVTQAFGVLKIAFLPDLNLLIWVAIAMVFDFITGVIKAAVKNEARTSAGYRKTVTKFTQYGGAIAAGVLLSNTLPPANAVTSYFSNALLVFITYIEATSIFENLYAIDNKSAISRFFIAPILKLLTFAIKKSPLNQAADEK